MLYKITHPQVGIVFVKRTQARNQLVDGYEGWHGTDGAQLDDITADALLTDFENEATQLGFSYTPLPNGIAITVIDDTDAE